MQDFWTVFKVTSNRSNKIYYGYTKRNIRDLPKILKKYQDDYKKYYEQEKGNYHEVFEVIEEGFNEIDKIIWECYEPKKEIKSFVRAQKGNAVNDINDSKRSIRNKNYYNKKKEYHQERYKENRTEILENLNQTVTCDTCKISLSKASLSRHNKSTKHKENRKIELKNLSYGELINLYEKNLKK